jgi:hypothetical protein
MRNNLCPLSVTSAEESHSVLLLVPGKQVSITSGGVHLFRPISLDNQQVKFNISVFIVSRWISSIMSKYLLLPPLFKHSKKGKK